MSKEMLSQEEIDALLRQNDLEDDLDEESSKSNPTIDEYLSPLEQDALGEIGNITFGSAATALSSLLGQVTDITTPKVGVIRREEVQDQFPHPYVAVHVEYTEGFQGINLLVIRKEDAQIIADLMMGGDGSAPPDDLSEIHLSAVQEAMNQMMGSAATSMSTIFNKLVNISPPGIDMMDLKQGQGVENIPQDDILVKVSFRLKVGSLIDSNIMQLIPIPFARSLVASLLGSMTEEEPAAAPEATPQTNAMPEPAYTAAENSAVPSGQGTESPYPQQPMYQQPPGYPGGMPPYPQQPMYQQPPGYPGYPQQPMYQQPYQAPQQPVYNEHQPPTNVQPVQFSAFDANAVPQGNPQNLGMLLDIPLKVTVELGRTKKQIKDILDLSPGSILELDKLAGEPVDILVNNKLIAKGEVVVIDENFGVRVTDILSQWDRIQKLQ
ncbi:flagellar motor switch phosphatase FliY [Aneurinibacillus aneurinilyticus]|uniref:Flagellar motor switch protein FliN n=1 Tax=Aneurinibacillus aneurinilyticus ATCC 12856 TaxID=649747 RepID=U1X2M0_ANEAE|nr:flagellar motor switch phosphatase FliY [Aneurinibacillus aneurinilyticus]ERI09220.1 flagellar motor switch protein FliN [Aneurinibacillus aneurinilyticus ATCC 12856]MED0707424.1 flagellar motor switch phosphatase FliY [Aneurinibacillus aneurinilyticus]MED0724768.1 flagellar motor switch phosphatase FliY [Aneurinibacillus aneurinilyticus]MED0733218.1 flagellar motor switch phosphatase FliY [Aneurinibacillus aneurinilyticus]MED0742805.1 flagellar motor switch phosphatase FliY [Aneurinibacill